MTFSATKKLSAKKGAKLALREREYWRFCFQASNVVMVSFFVSDHCFGALLEFIFTVTIRNSEVILLARCCAALSSLNHRID